MADCLVNGRPATLVDVGDRGLRYGDGLFETMAAASGRIPLWPLHLERLERGCRRLGLPVPDPAGLARDCDRLLADMPDCVLRLTWTRGTGGAGYLPPGEAEPTGILQRLPLPGDLADQQRDGIAAIRCATRLAIQPALAGLKHLNRLEQVLAAAECARAGVGEGIVCATDGRVIEALTGNLLLVLDDERVTPDLADCGVRGVGLAWLSARSRPPIRIGHVLPADLDRATEILVINSVRGIRPVTRLEGRTYEPGPVARDLQAQWCELFGGREA